MARTTVALSLVAAGVEPPPDGGEYMPPASEWVDFQNTRWTRGQNDPGNAAMFLLLQDGSAVSYVYQCYREVPANRVYVKWGSGAWLDPANGWAQVEDPTGGEPVPPADPTWIGTPEPKPTAGVAGQYPVAIFVEGYNPATDIIELDPSSIALPSWLAFGTVFRALGEPRFNWRSTVEPQFRWDGTQADADDIPAGVFLRVRRGTIRRRGTPVVSESIAVIVTPKVPVSWARTPAPHAVEGQAGSYVVTSDVANYNAATDVISVHSSSVAFPSWLSATPSPTNLTKLEWNGSQVDADDLAGVCLGVTREGHTAVSAKFSVPVSPRPVSEHSWERIDAAESFNALPAASGLKGPSFGGATTNAAGDVFCRNSGGSPHWNCFFRWNTRTMEGVTVENPETNDPQSTHNHMWCLDYDRNVFRSDAPAPAAPGWNASSIAYDQNTNKFTNPWPTNPGNPRPGDLGPPYYEAISGYESCIDYFDGSLIGWGNGGQAYGPIKRRNLTTNMTGLTVETLFPGDPFYPVPPLYAPSPATHDYLGNTAKFDSRTGQCLYVDPTLNLYVNNTVPDGTARGWVKIPVYGTPPVPLTPGVPHWYRHATLDEEHNCIVVIAWTEESYPSSFTSLINLSTLMWEFVADGDESPAISSYGIQASMYSGQLIYDRINKRTIYVVPHSASNGTSIYLLHIAGATL